MIILMYIDTFLSAICNSFVLIGFEYPQKSYLTQVFKCVATLRYCNDDQLYSSILCAIIYLVPFLLLCILSDGEIYLCLTQSI